ncbi:SPOR domain-containing protein [Hyphomicrobium sp. 99]|uniref:SPOR domain-containing protein n=1 Tax=Hyphomicrobium sp. 99 TaxID=1163419 RepID=UPI001FD9BF15|nr:SPOR domain-containing protein [Hyphomicrobium sp. 99]
MTQFQVLARPLALAAIVTCVFAGALAGWPSVGEARKAKSGSQAAQPAQGPQAGQSGDDSDANQKEAAKAAGRKAYDAGLKEYAAGRYQNAIGQLTIAVKAGVLGTSEMAKALYTRGLAYKRDNKPGLAISDLTSAIWLKNGLSPSDQKSAIAERSESYRMAGLADTGTTPDRPAVVAKPAAPGPNIVANPAPGPNAGSAGLSAAAIAEAAGNQNSSGTGSGDGTAASITRQDASNAQEGSSLQAAASPASNGAAPAEAQGGSSFGQTVSAIPGNVTGFFSNMFGGGSSAASAPPPPAGSGTVTTASTAATVPETSSWSNATTVADGGSAKSTKVALAATPKSNAVATKGKYKIHIAALRSRAEAEALAQSLVTQHGADLSNHVPTVDEAVIGTMGTFYRVRIGGYASQDEPRGLCNKLRSSGLDCLVVTN